MPPLVLCTVCHGGGDVHPTPYAAARCEACDGKGLVDSDGTAEPSIRDAETCVPCPSCVACHGCDGTHLVTKSRAAFILAAIKAQGGPAT